MRRKHIAIILFCLFVAFLVLRLPGIHLPYHQDEWKNIAASSDISWAGSYFTHPPLMALSFVAAHSILGDDDFRLFPLFFSLVSLLLLYAALKRRCGENATLWSLFLFTICFYNIFASIQPDMDGSLIPFFFLLCVYLYDNFNSINDRRKWKWLIFLAAAALIGFLIKLSFILVIGAIIADYVWDHWRELTVKKASAIVLGSACLGALYAAILYIFQAIYPAFSISGMLGHANQFNGEAGRNYMQIIVQGVKALYYLSPVLLAPLLLITKDIFKRTKLFFIYLVFGFIFYFILFDFSRGALDKYLMFAIVPLAAITGAVFSGIWKRTGSEKVLLQGRMKWPILIGIAISLALLLLNFLPHDVLALYPKTEWFSSALHFKWNILNPFTGGSGPTGFYVSFLFIASSFIVSLILVVAALFKKGWSAGIMIMLLAIGFTYNMVMAEELLFGRINGNVSEVLSAVSLYVKQDSSIKQVISYNDIGAHEFGKAGKYAGRFYATPDYESEHRIRFANYDHYVVIDIPHLYEYGFYGRFFSNCKTMFKTVSGRIDGRVYDCSQAKKLIPSL